MNSLQVGLKVKIKNCMWEGFTAKIKNFTEDGIAVYCEELRSEFTLKYNQIEIITKSKDNDDRECSVYYPLKTTLVARDTRGRLFKDNGLNELDASIGYKIIDDDILEIELKQPLDFRTLIHALFTNVDLIANYEDNNLCPYKITRDEAEYRIGSSTNYYVLYIDISDNYIRKSQHIISLAKDSEVPYGTHAISILNLMRFAEYKKHISREGKKYVLKDMRNIQEYIPGKEITKPDGESLKMQGWFVPNKYNDLV